ncbi:hypothetical protein SLA2020_272160 [Shorea laevis]
MWDATITPSLATLMGLCTLPPSRLGNGSDTIYNDPHHPHDTILSAFGSPKPDFPKRHPSWYYSRRRTFNCEVLISSWPARL